MFDLDDDGHRPQRRLIGQQAEERYGSHEKTFEIPEDGVANIVTSKTGEVVSEQNVEAGDIWRMPIVKDCRRSGRGADGRWDRAREARMPGGVLAGRGTSDTRNELRKKSPDT